MVFIVQEDVEMWEAILDASPVEDVLAENDMTVAEALWLLWSLGHIQKPEWYERSEESFETSEDS